MSVPRVRHPHLCIQHGLTRHDPGRVSPFGNPRIKVRLATPRGISQPGTSFIASWRQGIHHLPFFSLTKTARARIRRSPLRISLVVALGTDFSAKTSRNSQLSHAYAASQVDARLTFIGTRTIRFSKIGTGYHPEDCMTPVRPSHKTGTVEVVELIGIEPTTSGLQSPRSPS